MVIDYMVNFAKRNRFHLCVSVGRWGGSKIRCPLIHFLKNNIFAEPIKHFEPTPAFFSQQTRIDPPPVVQSTMKPIVTTFLLVFLFLGTLPANAQPATSNYQIRTVVIDPGHGGHDSGCSGKHSREKHIALGIAKQLQQQLQDKYGNLLVILTRTTDRFVPLSERAAIANRNRADLFISIHCNYIRKYTKVRGSETYVMGLHAGEENLEVAKRENAVIKLEDNYENIYGFDPDSPEAHIVMSMMQNAYLEQSVQFAELIEARISASGRRSRGVKQAGFVVLRETTMPGVLVETGFLSNAGDEEFLRTTAGQRATAAALAGAFDDYKRQVEFAAPPVAQALNPVDNALYAISEPDETPTTAPAPPAPKREVVQPKSVPNAPMVKQVSYEEPLASEVPTYHVQLAASRVPLDTNSGRWTRTGFSFREIREGGYYKYQTSGDTDRGAALEKMRALRKRGFKDCFLVIYQNGERKILN